MLSRPLGRIVGIHWTFVVVYPLANLSYFWVLLLVILFVCLYTDSSTYTFSFAKWGYFLFWTSSDVNMPMLHISQSRDTLPVAVLCIWLRGRISSLNIGYLTGMLLVLTNVGFLVDELFGS